MEDINTKSPKGTRFTFRSLSIRQQLPILICLLLLTLIFLFGTISYIGIRKAAMEIGKERLRSLTGQLSTLLAQSSRNLSVTTLNVARREEIADYLDSAPLHPSPSFRTMAALQPLLADSQTAWVEIRDLQGKIVLHTGRNREGFTSGLQAREEKKGTAKIDPTKEITCQPDSSFTGKLYAVDDSIYYPVIATISRNKKAIGTLLRWRQVRAAPRSIAQLSQLVGTNAAFYFGNYDGSVWTDMVRPHIAPPIDIHDLRKGITYDRPEGKAMAYAMPIPGSKWIILVEISQALVLDAPNRFLYWIIAIGAILLIAGSLIAWQISRSFTRPLDRLMLASGAIAAGDYSSSVIVDRGDELGKLAASFNIMVARVHKAHEELEDKVRSRTEELQAVNKELEAFSYSVSHDLRAPLRAVSGYTMMLKEDYEDTFDEEAKRITGNIISNVKMMGRLIDDLIAFSRLGKREVTRRPLDMQALAEACAAELVPIWPDKKFEVFIDPLPVSQGDEDLLKQVWLNLIGNAFKYSSKNAAPRIEIGYRKEEGCCVYYVRDNGAGFDMKYADKLFKVFQRLHSHEEFEGTGIGLALAKRIIDKHKGKIWAESAAGQGATFYFSLPC